MASSRTGAAAFSSRSPCASTSISVFCHWRHRGEPTGCRVRARSAGVRASSSCQAAAAIASTGAPSGFRANRPSRFAPSVVRPTKGLSASAAHSSNSLRGPGRFQARGRMRLGGHAGNARLIGTGDIRTVVQTRHAAFLQRGPGLARRHQRADSAPEQISRYLSDRSRMACPSLKLVYGYTHSHRESIYVRVRLLPPRIRFAANMLIETPCDRVTLTGIKNFDLVCIRHVSDKVGLQPLNFFELSISRYTKVLYLSCV